MKFATPTPSQLRVKVAAILQKVPAATRIGLRAGSAWAGPPDLEVGGRRVPVVWCPSVLEFRETMTDPELRGKLAVLLTDREEAELGADALARLARGRLELIDRWEIVCELFRAQSLDPRLVGLSWMSDQLIEQAHPDGYPAVAGGVLDAETAWAVILKSALEFSSGRPDAKAVLRWTCNPTGVKAFLDASAEMKSDLRTWLESSAGPLGALLLRAVEAGHGADALSLGLALETVDPERADEMAGDSESLRAALRDCQVRLERYLGGSAPSTQDSRLWASLAADLAKERLLRPGQRDVQDVLARLDDVLRELRAEPFARGSDFSPMGLQQRLEDFAAAIDRLLEASVQPAAPGLTPQVSSLQPPASSLKPQASSLLSEVDTAAAFLLMHALMRVDAARRRTVQMAWRLCRFVSAPAMPGTPDSLAKMAASYATEGSYADWARSVLWEGDSNPTFNRSLRKLRSRLLELREAQNQRFGESLVQLCAASADVPGMLTVEQVLDEVVAPLASQSPLLMLVLDGVGHPILRELVADLDMRGWIELLPSGRKDPLLVLSGLPSKTEVSRTSLLCGKLAVGGQNEERQGFVKHPGLVNASGSRNAPALFHKAELNDREGGLADPVVAALGNTRQRVVGVVLNAVDDHLAKGDQLAVRWSGDTVPLLRQLLETAKLAGRIVVLTSDHGHVLERDCVAAPDDTGGDRWRADDGKLRAGEVVLRGPRILGGRGGSIIVPWTEKLRYGMKRHGYHGGVTPQEVLVPLVVLTTHSVPPEGWAEAPSTVPIWWEQEFALLSSDTQRGRDGATALDACSSLPSLRDTETPAAREEVVSPRMSRPLAEGQQTLWSAACTAPCPPVAGSTDGFIRLPGPAGTDPANSYRRGPCPPSPLCPRPSRRQTDKDCSGPQAGAASPAIARRAGHVAAPAECRRQLGARSRRALGHHRAQPQVA
ncbi:MAG: BREX-2 system phosphatase PglZ [Candidatus Wallbacteria bacterium]|nr:BREX-2 system phosphatase PglZ [Candidatus Wallbacteria bacterium]